MLCSNCKVNNASFFYTQNINGNESSVALCKECASKKNIGSSMVSPLFNSFFSSGKRSFSNETQRKKCSLCALTFQDILSMGKVGCPECYSTFKDELKDTIRSIHGSAKHVGDTPHKNEELITTEKEIPEEERLRNELTIAISEENYEKAAIIRDKIKALKGEL